MSRQLIESIVSGNMLEASDMLEAKLNEIRERKMYEMKRMYAAEAFGGMSKAEIEAKKKAGYRKAADVLKDPRERKLPPLPDMKKEKKISESWARAIKMGIKRTGTRLNVMRHIPGAMKDIAVDAAKSAVADPLDTASKVTKATGGAAVRAVKKAGDAPVFSDLKSIGMRNI
jgi:hypothetical protein